MKSVVNTASITQNKNISPISTFGEAVSVYIEIEHPSAGWVICSTSGEFTTFLNVDNNFTGNETGHEMLFESQEHAIRHILKEGLRNSWVVWKMC